MEPNEAERQTMTIEEAAKVLGVGRNNAYEAAQRGEIPTIRIGKRILVLREPLRRMLEGRHNRSDEV
jgi:excisionase family DNA binding protein